MKNWLALLGIARNELMPKGHSVVPTGKWHLHVRNLLARLAWQPQTPNSNVSAAQGNTLKVSKGLICHIYALDDFFLNKKKQASNAMLLCAFQGTRSHKDPLRNYMLAYMQLKSGI